jgi:hypothetical protein
MNDVTFLKSNFDTIILESQKYDSSDNPGASHVEIKLYDNSIINKIIDNNISPFETYSQSPQIRYKYHKIYFDSTCKIISNKLNFVYLSDKKYVDFNAPIPI